MKIKISALMLAVVLSLWLTSCGDKTVMTVGTDNINYTEYRYYLLNNKRDSFSGVEALDDKQLAELKSLTEENAKRSAAIAALAEKYGAKLTEYDKLQVEAYIASYKAEECYNDEAAYKASLESYYMTDELFRKMQEDTLIVYRTMDNMVSSGAIKKDEATISALMAGNELLCIKEIFLENPSEETREYVYNRAVEAHDSLKNGTDAAEVMRKYSSYNEADMSPEHGYYTTEYEMPEYIWQAAELLDDGEISEIIESVYGYHIVIRCEKDKAYMEKIKEDITERYVSSMYTKVLYEMIDTLEVKYTPYGEKIDLNEIS